MAEPAAGSTGRIFISYRREETAYPAGWLRFAYDTSRLLKVLETTLADVRTAQQDGTSLETPG